MNFVRIYLGATDLFLFLRKMHKKIEVASETEDVGSGIFPAIKLS